MKHWQETAEILARLVAEAEAGRRAALATVVRIGGSAYRRPGAKLLVREDGGTSGSVSGGCLEADVREVALAVLREGRPRLLRYDTGADDRNPFSLGLGCNGTVELLVQPATTPVFLASARSIVELLAKDEPVTLSTVLDGEEAGRIAVAAGASAPSEAAADGGLLPGATVVRAVGSARVFTEVLAPPPHLLVFGAGDDALPLARFAAEAGFRVSVVDHRPALLAPARFSRGVGRFALRPEERAAGTLPLRRTSYAVVKTHSLELDREWVRRLLASEVRYVGMLGPRARIDEILRALGAASDPRVYGPVGLDLGTEGPEQVALSIVAELLAVRSGRAPVHLRERRGAIHGS